MIVGKLLQLVGLFEVFYGLLVGIRDGAMAAEMKFAGLGVALFVVGRLVEKRFGRP